MEKGFTYVFIRREGLGLVIESQPRPEALGSSQAGALHAPAGQNLGTALESGDRGSRQLFSGTWGRQA